MIAAMRQRSVLTILLLCLAISPTAADTPSLLKMFRRAPQVDAVGSKSYQLSETDGPWLILASTQVGDGAQQRAEQLALEIRRDLKLPAFVYHEDFDFTGNVGINAVAARKLRYANQYRYEAYAVLVGEYDTVDHPSVDGDLARIRVANLPVFQTTSNETANPNGLSPIERVKKIADDLRRIRKDKQLGPMGKAFVTRNPMLPQSYFETPEVDSFVHELNDGVPNSLLKCDGKYTVVVKTFEGNGAFVDGKQEKAFEPSGDRLAKNAEQANKMTAALRSQGVEAYQFHDRFRSLVTVGSYDDLGRELPDGQFDYAADIRQTMKKYSALNVRPELARQVSGGTNNAMAANAAALIPFDVEPKPIIVPKTSKRSLYNAAFGINGRSR
jgi:hypothetical protein